MERMSANGLFFHRSCFRCSHCNCQLKIGGYSLSKGDGGEKGKFFCTPHYRQLFLSNPEAINYSRAGASKQGRKVEEVVQQEEAAATPASLLEPVKPISPVEPVRSVSPLEPLRPAHEFPMTVVEEEEEVEVVKTPPKDVPRTDRPVKLVLPESSTEMEGDEEWEVISPTEMEVVRENSEERTPNGGMDMEGKVLNSMEETTAMEVEERVPYGKGETPSIKVEVEAEQKVLQQPQPVLNVPGVCVCM